MKHIRLGLIFCILRVLPAQQGNPAGSDRDLILQLLNRIQKLEAEVESLKQGSKQVADGTPRAAITPPETPPAPAQPSASAVAAMAGMSHDSSLSGLGNMRIQGFSDVQYQATDRKGDHNSFGLGQFNLFISNRLSNKLSIVGEVVVEAESTNGIGIDLERLLIQYSASDYFNLSAGRYHTAIGYYNTAYHHATWLQTAIDRPFLFAFEDGGGILPIHNVGLSATGRIPSGPLDLSYIAEVGNGRTSRSPLDEPVQNRLDENNGKSVNFALISRPSRVPGFQAGFSVYRDRLHPEGQRAIGQSIFSGHAVYHSSRLEFMNELVVLRHAVDGGRVTHIPGFYSQAAVPFGKVKPYLRYEYMNVPASGPLFQDIGLLHGPRAGIRYDFSDFAAYKLEYFREITRTNSANGLRTQVSFTF